MRALRESTEYWEYDGSFLGFMTVVDRSFREKQFPVMILTPETAVESPVSYTHLTLPTILLV